MLLECGGCCLYSCGSRSRPLPARAVSILTAWFNDNRDHPYADGAEAAALAAQCQLSVAQLRKWLANRRLRTNSTKHIAEVVNRRRLKAAARRRYTQISRCPIDDELRQRWLVAVSGHVTSTSFPVISDTDTERHSTLRMDKMRYIRCIAYRWKRQLQVTWY